MANFDDFKQVDANDAQKSSYDADKLVDNLKKPEYQKVVREKVKDGFKGVEAKDQAALITTCETALAKFKADNTKLEYKSSDRNSQALAGVLCLYDVLNKGNIPGGDKAGDGNGFFDSAKKIWDKWPAAGAVVGADPATGAINNVSESGVQPPSLNGAEIPFDLNTLVEVDKNSVTGELPIIYKLMSSADKKNIYLIDPQNKHEELKSGVPVQKTDLYGNYTIINTDGKINIIKTDKAPAGGVKDNSESVKISPKESVDTEKKSTNVLNFSELKSEQLSSLIDFSKEFTNPKSKDPTAIITNAPILVNRLGKNGGKAYNANFYDGNAEHSANKIIFMKDNKPYIINKDYDLNAAAISGQIEGDSNKLLVPLVDNTLEMKGIDFKFENGKLAAKSPDTKDTFAGINMDGFTTPILSSLTPSVGVDKATGNFFFQYNKDGEFSLKLDKSGKLLEGSSIMKESKVYKLAGSEFKEDQQATKEFMLNSINKSELQNDNIKDLGGKLSLDKNVSKNGLYERPLYLETNKGKINIGPLKFDDKGNPQDIKLDNGLYLKPTLSGGKISIEYKDADKLKSNFIGQLDKLNNGDVNIPKTMKFDANLDKVIGPDINGNFTVSLLERVVGEPKKICDLTMRIGDGKNYGEDVSNKSLTLDQFSGIKEIDKDSYNNRSNVMKGIYKPDGRKLRLAFSLTDGKLTVDELTNKETQQKFLNVKNKPEGAEIYVDPKGSKANITWIENGKEKSRTLGELIDNQREQSNVISTGQLGAESLVGSNMSAYTDKFNANGKNLLSTYGINISAVTKDMMSKYPLDDKQKILRNSPQQGMWIQGEFYNYKMKENGKLSFNKNEEVTDLVKDVEKGVSEEVAALSARIQQKDVALEALRNNKKVIGPDNLGLVSGDAIAVTRGDLDKLAKNSSDPKIAENVKKSFIDGNSVGSTKVEGSHELSDNPGEVLFAKKLTIGGEDIYLIMGQNIYNPYSQIEQIITKPDSKFKVTPNINNGQIVPENFSLKVGPEAEQSYSISKDKQTTGAIYFSNIATKKK